MKIGVQNYTLRDQFAEDLPGTLKAISDMGLRYCEIGFENGAPPNEYRKMLDDNGLTATSAHVGIDTLENDLNKVVEYLDIYGTKQVIVPWLPESRYAGGWEKVGQDLEAIARNLKPHGFKLLYHNHSFEFTTSNGKNGLETLYDTTDPDLVLAELDTYWVQHGGGDPVAWIKKVGARSPMIHYKDMGTGPDRPFVEVGYGILDWDAIIAATKETPAAYALIELDISPRHPLESVRMSFEFLKAKGLAVE